MLKKLNEQESNARAVVKEINESIEGQELNRHITETIISSLIARKVIAVDKLAEILKKKEIIISAKMGAGVPCMEKTEKFILEQHEKEVVLQEDVKIIPDKYEKVEVEERKEKSMFQKTRTKGKK